MTAAAPLRELESRLREVTPSATVMSSGPGPTIDALSPGLAVTPDSAQSVAGALREANACGAAVIPVGGGTRLALGMPPVRYDLALHIGGLNRVVEYEPADLTVTVEAGMPLAELQRLLEENGQWLPLDPPGARESTIGGTLAVNASGPARIAFGTARDLVIGMTVATVDGALVKSGGRVVKNVAGYDMAKVHIGALGTLGVIVQATFKVAPLPKASRTLSIKGDSAEALFATALKVRDAGLPATGIAIWQPAETTPRLLLRFAGSPAAVDRSCSDVVRLASGAEQVPDSVWVEAGALRDPAAGVVLRASHAVSASGQAIAGLAPIDADILSYPTAGVTYGRQLAADESSYAPIRGLRAALEAGAGALVIESGPPELKRALEVWGAPRADFGLMRSLKQELDPKSTLNPGRYLGSI